MLSTATTLHALAMLVVTLGLIMGLGWLLRTYGTRFGFTVSKGTSTWRVTQRLPLSAHATLVEVETPTHTHVLVTANNHTTVVHSLARPAAVPPQPHAPVKKPRR